VAATVEAHLCHKNKHFRCGRRSHADDGFTMIEGKMFLQEIDDNGVGG